VFERSVERARRLAIRGRTPPRDEAIRTNEHRAIIVNAVRRRPTIRSVSEITIRVNAVPHDPEAARRRALT
jgi:hypothetical protein